MSPIEFQEDADPIRGLNPYSNGIYSMSTCSERVNAESDCVLILILMEYTL